jgi:hypothetical protein
MLTATVKTILTVKIYPCRAQRKYKVTAYQKALSICKNFYDQKSYMTDDLTNQILLFDVCSLYRIECAYKIRVSYLAHMNLKRQTVTNLKQAEFHRVDDVCLNGHNSLFSAYIFSVYLYIFDTLNVM